MKKMKVLKTTAWVSATAIAATGAGIKLNRSRRAPKDLRAASSMETGLLSRVDLSKWVMALRGVAMPDAWASGWNYYNQMESDFYLMVGYPSHTAWVNLTGGGNGPQNGMIGIANSIAQGMASAAPSNGISSCANAPSSGGFTTTVNGDSVDVTFATPSHTVPAGYTDGGTAYEKRANMVVTDATLGTIKVALEFDCGNGDGFAEFSVASTNPDTNDATVRNINLYIDGTSQANLQAELMMDMIENQSGGHLANGAVNDSSITRLNIDNVGGTFQLWEVNTYYRGGGGTYYYNGYRLGINGVDGASGSAYMDAAQQSSSLLAGTNTTYTTPSPGTYAFSTNITTSSPVTLQGCLNMATQVDPGSTALCAGQSLTAPTAPLVDSSGAFDFTWVENTLPGKITIDF